MKTNSNTVAAEAGHWYGKDGSCQYTYKDSKGDIKATTLRQARKLGLLPSVTTILSVYPKPFLDEWKQMQVLLSSLTLARLDDETDEDFIRRIIADSKQQAITAADKGAFIHGTIEKYLLRQEQSVEQDIMASSVIHEVMDYLGYKGDVDDFISSVRPEKSFASPYGYGGKVDLSSNDFVLDFKTKDVVANELPDVVYETYRLQLAAYANGLGIPHARRMICYVSTRDYGCKIVELCESNGVDEDFETFLACFNLWCKIKKYNPARWSNE